ncbi:MAG: hypothetical protein ABIQ95_04055 [Bdellovibrionia bacterium]
MQDDPFIRRQKCFQPPYCPNEKCNFHQTSNSQGPPQVRFFWSNGWAKTQCHPYRVRMFRCRFCKRNFRYTFFKLDFREQRPGLNSKIFSYLTCGVSNREIARRLKTSEHLIRLRYKKLAQWALVKQTERTQNLKIKEPIVYDGLEAFADSQYDPNHIQQSIGKDSLFIYDFNFAPLNRKGMMSPRQKILRRIIEEKVGRYPPKSIRASTREIFARLYERRADPTQPLIIFSDEHFQYRRAIELDLKDQNIQQITTSSKQSRNYKNHLFSVNHADLLIRQHIGAFSRETICFSKTHARMVGKYTLFMVWKNFFRPQFVKPHKKKPQCNINTPAMELGLTQKPLEFYEFFDIKRSPKQIPLNREWNLFYEEKVPYARSLAA